jgi:apolipoprotein N-acyltransferase
MNLSFGQNIRPYRGVPSFFLNLGLAAGGALLFAASFPNLLFENGLPLLAWIAYVPVFYLVRRTGWMASIFWGALYGYAAYGLFNYWLSVFHPLAGLIVDFIYMVYFALLFPCLKLAAVLFPRRAYILQFLFWMVFEYLRTLGFLGYSYGITGYSQWRMLPVIQIAAVFGVWGVSALAVFPSAFLAGALSFEKGKTWEKRFGEFCRRNRFAVLAWGLGLAGALVYGFLSPVDYAGAPGARIALIQHNSDPWRGGIEEYRNNFRTLRRLSDEALAAEPKPDLVVWSETAFVPRIHWHMTVRDDPASYILVKELLDYLALQDTPFVIGNDDARKEPDKNPFQDNRVDYNAVMLYHRGKLTDIYRKLRLVPFTEHFPYGKQFPWIYNALINADTHFWEKGDKAVVFDIQGLKFSSPICFEDTFGYLSRNFVLRGAELIVNLSNDAWSKSLPAQTQHLSMAVFRAVENRRSVARATASGQTAAIDPNGRVIAMAEPFTEAFLTAEVPVLTVNTFYTRYGDYLPIIFMVFAFLLLIIGIVSYILRRIKNSFPAD